MSNILACYQLLELNVISAQDLAPVGRSMQTYAVAWIDPDRKLSTRVDSEGGVNPAWNDKFAFRVDEDFIYDDSSVITIDIYALHWFKDIHVGTAHVVPGDVIPPPTTSSRPSHNKPSSMRFVGVQVHRPSGRPKGVLNVGVAVLDSTMRSMPLYTTPAVGYDHHDGDDDHHHDEHNDNSHQTQPKPELRRTKSDTSSMIGPEAVAHEKRAKAKKAKASSVVTTSEASTKPKSKKKTGSMLSGSGVRPKPRKGKSGITKKGSKGNSSPEHTTREYNAVHHDAPLRISDSYEVKPSPRPQFRNSPAMAYNATPHNGLHNNNNNNSRGAVRATPLHAYAAVNAALEYGTPYRSKLGRRPMMTDSELGPSASEVAAAVARQPLVIEEGENSTVGGWSLDESVEGFQPKIERWRTELPTVYDGCEMSSSTTRSSKKGRHSRRHTDGGDGNNGLFSCFSVICGVECSIVCGGDRKKKNLRRRAQSVDDASFR